MPGRKKLPTALKLMRGTVRADRANPREPQLTPAIPEAFAALTPAAQEHFNRLSRQLKAIKVSTEIDGAALSALAQAMAHYEAANKALADEGLVIEGRGGESVRNPWLIIQKQAWEQMQRGFTDFGLTPSARAKIHTAGEPQDNDEERFFGT